MKFKNFYICPRCIVKWNDIWEIEDPPQDFKNLAMFWARQFEDECPKCGEPCSPYFTAEEEE